MDDYYKKKVLEQIDDRIELLERKLKSFENFGEYDNVDELMKKAIRLEIVKELKSLKGDILYGIR